MLTKSSWMSAVLAGVMLSAAASAADMYGLSEGKPEVKSIGHLAFGPDSILFLGDSASGAVFAIQTGDKQGTPAKAQHSIDGLNERIAEQLGGGAKVQILDVAVNPQTGNVFIAASNGQPQLLKLSDGKLEKVSLDKAKFSKVALKDAPAPGDTGHRGRPKQAITDLAFVDGFVLVAGDSTAKAQSSIRTIAFPFAEVGDGASLEIFHAAHAATEDYATVRTFVPFIIDGEPNVLAGFTCTPLVRFPLSDLKAKSGEKLKGKTVAELGNRNQPLDIIAYKKDGKSFLLMANNNRGVMKVSTEGLAENAGLTEPVRGGGTAGQSYETIADWQGVVQLDKLNDNAAIVVVQNQNGSADLRTLPLP